MRTFILLALGSIALASAGVAPAAKQPVKAVKTAKPATRTVRISRPPAKGAPAAKPPAKPGQPQSLTHAASGFMFPPTVGRFRRASYDEFGRDSSGVSVGYDLLTPGSEMEITVFVSRAPSVGELYGERLRRAQRQSCLTQFEARRLSLEEVNSGARLVEQLDIPSPSPVHDPIGKRAVYEFQQEFLGRPMLVRSESDLFCYVNGDWLVAYRLTAPASVLYRTEFDQFMHGLAWPEGIRRGLTAQAAPDSILVQERGEPAETIMAGLIAHGTTEDLDKFDEAARQRGIRIERMRDNGGPQSISLFLVQRLSRKKVLEFYHEARGGIFGAIRLEVLVLSPENIRPGRQRADAIRIIAPDALSVPLS